MAAVWSETTRASASYTNIELMFDLDTVLSGSDDFGGYCVEAIVTPPDSLVVASLPTVVSDDVCAVCMEDFQSDEGGKQIPCGHVYHEACISSWLSVGDCCPLCRCHISSGEKTGAPKTVQA